MSAKVALLAFLAAGLAAPAAASQEVEVVRALDIAAVPDGFPVGGWACAVAPLPPHLPELEWRWDDKRWSGH